MRDTILIVEDDEMICQGIVDALQLRNWKTDVAATCEEAEKKIKEYTYMLYILDMKLPDGNGISLCRKIRTATENPVLFLSAYGQYILRKPANGLGNRAIYQPAAS